MENHNYSLNDLNTMLPWEREIYVTMLINHLEMQRQAQEK
jgi:hypothetical protein